MHMHLCRCIEVFVWLHIHDKLNADLANINYLRKSHMTLLNTSKISGISYLISQSVVYFSFVFKYLTSFWRFPTALNRFCIFTDYSMWIFPLDLTFVRNPVWQAKVMPWKCFPYHCLFVNRIRRWMVDSLRKGPVVWSVGVWYKHVRFSLFAS